MSHNQNPVLTMVYPEPCKELRRRISAAISGWDCSLLTFTYPGVEHVTQRKAFGGELSTAAQSDLKALFLSLHIKELGT